MGCADEEGFRNAERKQKENLSLLYGDEHMIGKLTGIIDTLSGHQIILDVQGVGYLVSCSAHTLRLAGGTGDPLSLWIETWVREDAINLYGFSQEVERDWFKLLTTVQGVGAKAALAILSVLSPESLSAAIAAQDKAPITAADGIGPKLATRILTELKDKVAHFPSSTTLKVVKGEGVTDGSLVEDTVSALLHLGYRRMEAFVAASSAQTTLGTEAKLDTLIRAALIELSPKDKSA
jgi:Holliday junction DNA helicase RuvA